MTSFLKPTDPYPGDDQGPIKDSIGDPDDEIYKFESEEKFHITDRGDVYIVKAPHEYPRDKCPFMNKDVFIDGQLFHVIGIESFAVCPTRKDALIGILVKGDPAK